MRRAITQRILAIGLILSRLVFADVVYMPEVQAATQPVGEMSMMTGMPCHDGMEAVDSPVQHQSTKHHTPAGGGTCCKSSQCLCAHAPALATKLVIPTMSLVSLTTVASPSLQRATERESVFFRPPI